MKSVNRPRYQQYADRIAHLEAFLLISSSAPEEWGLHLYPPAQLAELREEAEQELKEIREYCTAAKPIMPRASARDPVAQQARSFVELVLLLTQKTVSESS